MAVPKHELFRDKDGQLYVVVATTLGEYSLFRVHTEYVRRFARKYLAVEHAMTGRNDG